jgi:peptide/nickel transport system permease protein
VTGKVEGSPVPAPRRRGVALYWSRLRRQPVALAGTVIFVLFLLIAIFGPLVAPYDFAAQDAADRLQGPSLHHLMGTDNFGRDIFSRVLVGTREVFLMGGAGTLFAAIIGTSLGLLAGYVGRLWDEAIMRVLDVLLAFPALLLALVLLATVGPSKLNLILVITVLYIPMFARIARSMVLDLRTREFVEAARLRGESRSYILFREMLPNAVPPLLVEASIRFAYSIFLVASLGFLGLGVQPPSPDWGRQVNEARTFFDAAPWMLLFPAAAISLLVIGTSLMADGLRHVFSPPGSARASDVKRTPSARARSR